MRSRFLGAPLACALVLSSVVVLSAGCSETSSKEAGASDDGRTRSTKQGIQGGAPDNATHPFAVGVCIGPKANCNGICSGALILPNVVVTARHCVQDTDELIDCATSTFGANAVVDWVTTGDWMFETAPSAPAAWHPVKSVVVPADTSVCGNDIALIVLNDVIPSSEATPVIPGVQYAMGDDRYTHSYSAVGYGKTSEADPTRANDCFATRAPATPKSSEPCPGLRRIVNQVPLVCIPDDANLPCPPLVVDGSTVATANEFIGGEGVCPGDSGSSAFETSTFQAGAPVTFGVLSRGGADPDHPNTCGQTVYTRLDKFRDFVVQTATSASKNWSLYPKPVPDWTVFVPPVDAGTDAKTPTKPTNLGDGVSCEDNSECASSVCADTGSGMVCTVACVDSASPTTCQGGYVCSSSVCVIAPPAPTTTTTTKSCSVGGSSPGSGGAGGGGLAVLCAVGLVLNTRRGMRRSTIALARKTPPITVSK